MVHSIVSLLENQGTEASGIVEGRNQLEPCLDFFCGLFFVFMDDLLKLHLRIKHKVIVFLIEIEVFIIRICS